MSNKEIDLIQWFLVTMAISSLVLCMIADYNGDDYGFILILGFANLLACQILEKLTKEG